MGADGNHPVAWNRASSWHRSITHLRSISRGAPARVSLLNLTLCFFEATLALASETIPPVDQHVNY